MQIRDVFHKLKDIRQKVVLPRLEKFGDLAVLHSLPIVRPMWMAEPDNPDAQKINDQFMIGDEILVAPVMDPGVRYRNVYLPLVEDRRNANNTDPVIWKCGTTGKFFRGGEWRYDLNVRVLDYI